MPRTTASTHSAFTDRAGTTRAVRWAMVPETPYAPITDAQKAEKNFLQADLDQRLDNGPLRWHLILSVAQPGDPTDDATLQWPDDRQQIDAGTLVLDRATSQEDGTCRDINFDPTILPAGIKPSDDPLARRALGRVCAVLPAPHARRDPASRGSSNADQRRSLMTPTRTHFSPLARLLHWTMAPLIIAMLFIGVGMVATVSRAHNTLIAIHKPLGIALLLLVVLRVGVRLTRGSSAVARRHGDAPAYRGQGLASRAVRADGGDAVDRLGDAVRGGLSGHAIRSAAFAADRAA